MLLLIVSPALFSDGHALVQPQRVCHPGARVWEPPQAPLRMPLLVTCFSQQWKSLGLCLSGQSSAMGAGGEASWQGWLQDQQVCPVALTFKRIQNLSLLPFPMPPLDPSHPSSLAQIAVSSFSSSMYSLPIAQILSSGSQVFSKLSNDFPIPSIFVKGKGQVPLVTTVITQALHGLLCATCPCSWAGPSAPSSPSKNRAPSPLLPDGLCVCQLLLLPGMFFPKKPTFQVLLKFSLIWRGLS